MIKGHLGPKFLRPEPMTLGLTWGRPYQRQRPSSLKEKTRRSLQLLGGFKQELAAHTLFALFVSRNVRCVDAKPCG